jgi:hypothetical protein
MKLPEIYEVCRQAITANEKFVQLFKDGKTGPLIGAAMKNAKGAVPAQVAEVIGILMANPAAQPDPNWEQIERDENNKKVLQAELEAAERIVENERELVRRRHFCEGALFAYENVMHILETDREVRKSHNWPMGEMYETLWSNVFIHVNPAIKAFKK